VQSFVDYVENSRLGAIVISSFLVTRGLHTNKRPKLFQGNRISNWFDDIYQG